MSTPTRSSPPRSCAKLLPYVRDPAVGGLSGVSTPRNPGSWLGCMRLMEVYCNIAFVRSAQSALDVVMVMPGVLASYRRELVVELGGFGEGFNGEDADNHGPNRTARLSDRQRPPDPCPDRDAGDARTSARATSALGARLFHMAARTGRSSGCGKACGGLLLLPWSILNSARRSLMLPLLVGAVSVEVADPAIFSMREISVMAGAVVSVQLGVLAVLLLAHRQIRALLTLPSFLVFRLFRAYVTLEALLTLPLRPPRRRTPPGGLASYRFDRDRDAAVLAARPLIRSIVP